MELGDYRAGVRGLVCLLPGINASNTHSVYEIGRVAFTPTPRKVHFRVLS